jgi:hypothetical protein
MALSSDDYLIPPLVLLYLPTTAVCGPSDMVTLSLTLKTLGVVLHPPNISSSHPASDSDSASFEAFTKSVKWTIYTYTSPELNLDLSARQIRTLCN